MSYDSLAILSPNLVPAKFLCISCGNVVYPDRDHSIKDQAECDELICYLCERSIDKCTNHGLPFTKSVHSSKMFEEIGELFIRCKNLKNCKWVGPLADYTRHTKNCKSDSDALKVKHQNTEGLASTAQEMAKRYGNAHFSWSWQDEIIDGVPVLSSIRRQERSMCAFYSTTSAFEALLRLKGKKVMNLSWRHLYKDYTEEMTKPDVCKKSRLIRIAEILKEKGMVQLSSTGVALKPEIRWRISDFRKFKMRTKEGIEAALNHLKEVGPIVVVHHVTTYQRCNSKSAGIRDDRERCIMPSEYTRGNAANGKIQTHSVCAIGMGAEDMTPYLPYQNSAGVEFLNEGFGRVLPSCILEAVGFFIDEDCERPLKRAKTDTKKTSVASMPCKLDESPLIDSDQVIPPRPPSRRYTDEELRQQGKRSRR